MQITLILVISIVMQFLAAILALKLIPATGGRKAWIAISIAISLMAFRRCITLFQLVSGKVDYPSDLAGLGVEWVTLIISAFMLAGIYWIAPLFLSIRRSAEALRESEVKYRSLFEKSRDAVYLTDHGGRLIDLNRSCLELFGYSREEMVGMDARKLYVDFSERKKLSEELSRNGYVRDYEIKLCKKDGSAMDCLLTTTVQQAADGAVLGYQGIVRDITMRKEMERALRKTNEVLNAILAAAPVGIGLVRNRIFDWANRAMYKLVGYDQSSLLKKDALVLYPDHQEYERVGEELYEGLEESCSVHVDTQWVRKDGSMFYCLLQACPLDPADPYGGEIVAVLDVSERKRAEEALRESEARYRTLFQAANDAILLMNTNGVCTDCNQAAERLFLCSREKILGSTPFRFSPGKLPNGESSPERSSELIRSVLNGASERFEWQFYLPGGPYLETDVTLSRVSVSRRVEILAVIRDMSKQKEAQKRLQEEMEHLTSVLDGSPVASCMIDCDGKVVLWNRACEMLTCISRNDVLGLPLDLSPLFEGKSLPVLAEMLLRKDEEEILKRFETVKPYAPSPEAIEGKGYIVVNGKHKSLRIIAARVRDASGAMRGVFQCAEDITGEEELRRQLLHALKMEAVGRLAGGVAHDFNNVLMAVMCYAELVMMRLGQDNPLWSKVEEIRKASERASTLTRQLLAFSRKQMFQPEILNLNVLITDLERMLRRLIGEDIDLVTVLEPTLCRVKIDPAQVEQIITNLVINARDAMPEGGRIIIETANVDLDEGYASNRVGVRPGSYAMLSVADTGLGMSSETLANIFEPFFTTKEEGKGTGLGLSSVYGIVQQNEGHIWVDSQLQKGTVFKIYLPRIEGSTSGARPPKDTSRSALGFETVLVVEDDDVVRAVVSEALRAHGYTVLEARKADEALEVVSGYNETIHLLVTDIVMPGMNGRELAERLAVSRPGLKILFMSGYTDMGTIYSDSMGSGTGFLQKPFSTDALLHKMRDLLEMRS